MGGPIYEDDGSSLFDLGSASLLDGDDETSMGDSALPFSDGSIGLTIRSDQGAKRRRKKLRFPFPIRNKGDDRGGKKSTIVVPPKIATLRNMRAIALSKHKARIQEKEDAVSKESDLRLSKSESTEFCSKNNGTCATGIAGMLTRCGVCTCMPDTIADETDTQSSSCSSRDGTDGSPIATTEIVDKVLASTLNTVRENYEVVDQFSQQLVFPTNEAANLSSHFFSDESVSLAESLLDEVPSAATGWSTQKCGFVRDASGGQDMSNMNNMLQGEHPQYPRAPAMPPTQYARAPAMPPTQYARAPAMPPTQHENNAFMRLPLPPRPNYFVSPMQHQMRCDVSVQDTSYVNNMLQNEHPQYARALEPVAMPGRHEDNSLALMRLRERSNSQRHEFSSPPPAPRKEEKSILFKLYETDTFDSDCEQDNEDRYAAGMNRFSAR